MNVFIDSNVVISSLISSRGAAYALLHQSSFTPTISSVSYQELRIVTKKMNLPLKKLEVLVKKHCQVVKLTQKLPVIKQQFANYVTDINDAYIVAGAHSAKAKYLISYNLKHFQTTAIKDKLDILIMTPALFLQFLRSN